jgi:hypothetical protein
MKIEKSEIKYLFMSYIFIVLLAIISGVESIRNAVSIWNPVYQFLLLNLGLYFVFFFLIKGLSLGTGRHRVFVGAIGSVLAFMSLDLLLPEFHVAWNGTLIAGGIFGKSATDYFLGYLYSTLLNISGPLLWILVYPVTFTILFIIGAFLVDNFIKNQI